jgi:hypothetical protein
MVPMVTARIAKINRILWDHLMGHAGQGDYGASVAGAASAAAAGAAAATAATGADALLYLFISNTCKVIRSRKQIVATSARTLRTLVDNEIALLKRRLLPVIHDFRDGEGL